MKRIIALFLVLVSVLTVFSSCSEKHPYTFDNPYKYSNYTSETATYTHGIMEETGVLFSSRAITFESFIKDRNSDEFKPYALLKVSRKNSDSYFWEEHFLGMNENGDMIEGDYFECTYTVTTLNILEVLEGQEDFVNELKNESEIRILEPYGINPSGEFCYHAVYADGLIMYNTCARGEYDFRVIDNSNEFIIILFKDRMISGDTEITFSSRSSEKHIITELEGVYHTDCGLHAEFTEEKYNEVKDKFPGNEEDYVFLPSTRKLSEFMLKRYWEKYHA